MLKDKDGKEVIITDSYSYAPMGAIISSDGENEWTEKDFKRLEGKIDRVIDRIDFLVGNNFSKYELDEALKGESGLIRAFGQGLGKGLREY